MDPTTLEVRVLYRVDVDREAVGVARPALWPWADHVAAVEPGGVVGLERALVDPAVCIDGAQAADREARPIEPAENADDVPDDRHVHDDSAGVRAAVEAPVRQPHPSQPSRRDRAAAVPRVRELRGCDARDRIPERRLAERERDEQN